MAEGTAWARFLGARDRPVLHDRDGSHPTLAGSYLAACVFYGTLLKESPVGIGAQVAGLSEEDRATVQAAASEVCRPPGRKKATRG
jgi:hypothetical protein